jgi:hypothetical protein
MAKVQRLVAEREDEIEAEWNRRRKEAAQQVPPPPPTPEPAWDMAAWKERDYAEMARWEQSQGLAWAASDERFVVSEGIVLKRGVGSPASYAQTAEETYTGYSYGGPESPITWLASLIPDAVVWIRDNTLLLDWMKNKGWVHADASATIFYKPTEFPPVTVPDLPPIGFPNNPLLPTLPPGSVLIPGGQGITITAVQINNSSGEVLHIERVSVNVGNEQIKAFPFEYPTLVSPDYNSIQPGDIFRLNIEPIEIPPSTRAEVKIVVGSETGRWGIITQGISP